VPRIRGTGAEFDVHFEKDLSKFPFPARVSSRFGDALHKNNSDLNSSLYNRLPFPHLKAPVLDKFEKKSLDFLEANPTAKFFRIETKNGRDFIRYARAMILAVIASLMGGLLVWPVVTRLHRTLHSTEQWQV